MSRPRLVLLLVYLSVSACMPVASNGQTRANDPVGAAVFAASNVAGSAVNRKLTGECYAACTPGSSCNHETGLCERIACACPADQICERIGTEVVCRQAAHREGALGPVDAGDEAGEEPTYGPSNVRGQLP